MEGKKREVKVEESRGSDEGAETFYSARVGEYTTGQAEFKII